MRVKDLIAKLQELDPLLPIAIIDDHNMVLDDRFEVKLEYRKPGEDLTYDRPVVPHMDHRDPSYKTPGPVRSIDVHLVPIYVL
jgi:hypothetical protein